MFDGSDGIESVSRAGGRKWIGILLLAFALSLRAAAPAQADDCSAFPGGVLDGCHRRDRSVPDQHRPELHDPELPGVQSAQTNFSFYTQPGQTDERWLVIFDNVVHTGQMACNAVARPQDLVRQRLVERRSTQHCQNLLIPVEKIDKQNPAGQHRRPIGVPFTYRLTIPVLFDPATGTVDQRRRLAQRPARHHASRTISTRRASPHLREPRRLLAGQRRAGAAHVLQRRRPPHLRQLSDRPGRDSRSSSSSRSCSRTCR